MHRHFRHEENSLNYQLKAAVPFCGRNWMAESDDLCVFKCCDSRKSNDPYLHSSIQTFLPFYIIHASRARCFSRNDVNALHVLLHGTCEAHVTNHQTQSIIITSVRWKWSSTKIRRTQFAPHSGQATSKSVQYPHGNRNRISQLTESNVRTAPANWFSSLRIPFSESNMFRIRFAPFACVAAGS